MMRMAAALVTLCALAAGCFLFPVRDSLAKGQGKGGGGKNKNAGPTSSSSLSPATLNFGNTAFSTPDGLRTQIQSGAMPTMLGPQQFFQMQSFRPLVAGPMHMIYFDPLTRTYRYTTGAMNTPTYLFTTPNPTFLGR